MKNATKPILICHIS